MYIRRHRTMLHQNYLLQVHMALFAYVCLFYFMTLPEVVMMIPNPVDDHVQETAVCMVTVKAWLPFLTTGDEMDVSTNNDCVITKGPIKNIDVHHCNIFYTG